MTLHVGTPHDVEVPVALQLAWPLAAVLAASFALWAWWARVLHRLGTALALSLLVATRASPVGNDR